MITTITGSNSFARSHALKTHIDAFIAAEGDMALERLDGEDTTFERIQEAITSVPFLSNKKMVVLRQGSANKQFAEQAVTLLGEVTDTTEVLLVEPKLDKRSAYYKFLKQSSDYREYAELDAAALTRWLVSQAKEMGGALKPADAALLINRIGPNQQLLASELEKLLLYNATVTREAIMALTDSAPQSTVFELLAAAFGGNTAQALTLYDEQRALKVEPQQIIAMLTWQLHILALIKTAGDRSPEAIASQAKVSPYVVKKSLSIARQLSLAQVKQLLHRLIEIDTRSKRENYDLDDALQLYLLALAQS